MEVVIVGAGQVGESIAASLQAAHNVVLIERDGSRASELQHKYDILTITGDGTDLEVLEEAGVADADMVLASTDRDETNIVACLTAKVLSGAFTVCRVKASKYLETWRRGDGMLGVDRMICTDLLTAEEIVGIIGLPGAHDFEMFAEGAVLMAEFDVAPNSGVAGQTVQEADRFDSLTFAAISDGESIDIPDGESVIRPGTRVVVIGSPQSVQSFASEVDRQVETDRSKRVVVVGGNEIAHHSTRLLAERGFEPILIVQEHERARRLAEALPDVRVIQTDATDVSFLETEELGAADALIAALESAEENLLECILARDLGIDRTVAVIDHPKFVRMFEKAGVDVALSPRDVVAEAITQFTQEWHTEKLALIESDQAEVVELVVDEASLLAERRIEEALAEFDHELVIGAVTRGGEFIIPRGDTRIEPDDHVILFLRREAVSEAIERL
ncbi:MAG: Trk system potassium transporter TrkA [Halobacteriota archaeon]